MTEQIKNFMTAPLGTLPNCHDGKGVLDFTELFAGDEFQAGIRFFHHTVLPPDTSIGMHKHGNDQEIYIVLKGNGIMNLDGVEYSVGPGDVIVNKPYGEHGIENHGTEHLELLVFEVVIDKP